MILSSVATSAAPSPETLMRLRRVVAPDTTLTSRGAAPSASARSRTSAALAAPSLGAARTRALRTLRPSASRSIPSMASRPPFGVSRTAIRIPSDATVQGFAWSAEPDTGRPERASDDEPEDQVAYEQQAQNQDHRRDVDAAEIRQDRADRPQRRFGDAVEEIPDRSHHRIARVDHVEGDQPGEDRGADQYPDVKSDDRVNEPEKGVHAAPVSGKAGHE